jgi:hypothetical protein
LTFPVGTTATALTLTLPAATGVTSFSTAFAAGGLAVFELGTTESADFLVGI